MLTIPPLAIAALQDKNIVVLGAGLTGLSCVRFLHACNITCAVNDNREAPIDTVAFAQKFPDTKLTLGYWNEDLITQADIILASPGIDLVKTGIKQMIAANAEVWGDIELFCFVNQYSEKPLPILAVTGSNGKSTAVSMLAHVGNALNVNTALGGNIGQPVLDLFTIKDARDQESNHSEQSHSEQSHSEKQYSEQNLSAEQQTKMSSSVEMLVLELSSFQLETITRMHSLAATVLNVSDDHLDRHITLNNYQAIKQRIYQNAAVAITNRDDERTQTLGAAQPMISFGSDKPTTGHFGLQTSDLTGCTELMFGDEKLIELSALPLAGIHNALNYLAVLALGYSAGWPMNKMIEGLKTFTGLAHRCQVIPTTDNVAWINDSKATNVGATLAAINGLAKTKATDSQLILIAGGDGKGADFSSLKKTFIDNISCLITLGKDGDKIASLVENTSIEWIKVTSLKEAVVQAKERVKPNDIVLLSPACASLDMFKNFMARGECFSEAVNHVSNVSNESQVSNARDVK